jgi:hypothetical protein
MKRKPSPPHQTTVLSRVKGSRASHAGFSALLDPACAPWWNKLWAVDEGGLRTKEVALDKNKSQTQEEQTAQSCPCGQGMGSRVGESSQFPKRLLNWRTLDDRPRQLRDEGMSGVNQHAYIRLIHRRYLLLVP